MEGPRGLRSARSLLGLYGYVRKRWFAMSIRTDGERGVRRGWYGAALGRSRPIPQFAEAIHQLKVIDGTDGEAQVSQHYPYSPLEATVWSNAPSTIRNIYHFLFR